MDKSVWEKTIGENADKEGIELCDRSEERICAKKGEGVSIIQGGKRRGQRVHKEVAKEGIYLAIKVTTNSTGILCRKEGWEETDGARLQIFE